MGAAGAGLAFGAVMFAAGFGLGALRSLVIAPRLGEVPAVLAEVPVMLALAWFVAGRLMRRSPAATATVRGAIAMGGVALAALWALELAMVVVLFGVPLAEAPAAFLTPGGRIGLAAQVAMALFPVLRLLRGSA